MPYFYEYRGDDQDLVVESDEPRPDLLEWAYWEQVDAPERSEAASAVSLLDGHEVTTSDHDARIEVLDADSEPEPEPEGEPEPEPAPEPKAAPKKAAPRKRTPKASAGE